MRNVIKSTLPLISAGAVALSSAPFTANPAAAKDSESADGAAADLADKVVSLSDTMILNYGVQGSLQGAGTPNEAGFGAFFPLHVGSTSVVFADVLVNANIGDFSGYSSIINTEVSGLSFSTSTRLGYRWLNSDQSMMYGVIAGYDSRPMATGRPDNGVDVTNTGKTVFFQQLAASLEVFSSTWNVNAYALVPVGTTSQELNSIYRGGALDTYGLDAGYSVTPKFQISVGYFYQNGDLGDASGSGVRGRLNYNLVNGLTIGANLSHDEAFGTRISANFKYRISASNHRSPRSEKQRLEMPPVMEALSSSPTNRDVRVHDDLFACIPENLYLPGEVEDNPTYLFGFTKTCARVIGE